MYKGTNKQIECFSECNRQPFIMIHQQFSIPDQVIRNQGLAMFSRSAHQNLGFNLQCNGCTFGGLCLPVNNERDFYSPAIHSSDVTQNPTACLALNDGISRPMYVSDFQMYYPAVHFQPFPLLSMKTSHIVHNNRGNKPPSENSIENSLSKINLSEDHKGLQSQDFQYFVVIDFEATCDTGKQISPQEIIEFPSVLVNAKTGEMEGHFHTYLKPIYHPILTDFCKELTGIQQSQVTEGISLSEALLLHDTWLEEKGIKNTNFAIVTWSDWDCKVMLESECNMKGIRKPTYFNRWINLKIPFCKTFNQQHCNLKGAVQLAGLTWEGRAHCGLDDAKNTANILVDLMKRGVKFQYTSCMHLPAISGLRLPSQNRPSRVTVSKSPGVQGSRHSSGNGRLNNSAHEDKKAGTLCYCGVPSNRCIIKKPGPRQGKTFFACGNWSVSRGSACSYFEWAVPDITLNVQEMCRKRFQGYVAC